MVAAAPDRLFVVRLDDGRGDGPSPAQLLAGVRRMLAAGSGAGPGEVAALGGPVVADDLGDVTHVLAIGTGGATFQLAPGDDFGAYVEATGVRVVAAEVAWAPDLDPDVKKGQALELTRLAAWLHETDRLLLVEVVLDTTGAPDGDDQDEAVRKAVREIREVGVEADLWAIPLPADAESADALGALVTEAGRDDTGFLAVVAESGQTHGLRRVSGAAGYRGFVLGSAFWSATGARETGSHDADAAVADEVATRLRQAIQDGTPGTP